MRDTADPMLLTVVACGVGGLSACGPELVTVELSGGPEICAKDRLWPLKRLRGADRHYEHVEG
jgi:hypothetical protein